MKKVLLCVLLLFVSFGYAEESTILFTPPKGWRLVDKKDLTPHVKAMVVGKGKYAFPPSINLGVEEYQGSVRDYLINEVKATNDASHDLWQDLGSVQTQAGTASLSQVDMKTKWGDARLMHAILKKDQTLYVLTVAALKKEFPSFYKDFFNTIRSLRFSKNSKEESTDSTQPKKIN